MKDAFLSLSVLKASFMAPDGWRYQACGSPGYRRMYRVEVTMRRFSTLVGVGPRQGVGIKTVLVAAAAIAVTATTAGSAYAGESATIRLDSPALFIAPSSTDYEDDLLGGCRSHREDVGGQSESIKR